mgnify:FL=1|tara:strand:+ start:1341 stop:1877 length:537 start_codon:yes stop_codon:yes gene_type:complete
MYFSKFPFILYDSSGNFDFKVVTNLLRRVALRTKLREDTLIFDTYDVKDGETPEILAHRLYGDSELHWVILSVNNITDRYHQWPKPYIQHISYLNEKYPTSAELNALHHYEIEQTSGDTTVKINIGKDNTDFPSATAISNFDFEEDLQNKQRSIRLLDPSYLEQFIQEFEDLMQESDI